MDEMPMRHEIERMIRTGDLTEPTVPHCPICGSECEQIYYTRGGDIVGCDQCLYKSDAWDVDDCFDSPASER